MVIKLDPENYGERSLRLRIPNGSTNLDKLPGINEKIILGLKITDSYFVEAANGRD